MKADVGTGRVLPLEGFRSSRRRQVPRPIVLVSLDWIRQGDPRTGLGTASIASSLRLAGVDVRIVSDAVNAPGFDADAFIGSVVATVEDAGAGALVGIGGFVWCEPEVLKLLTALRGRAEIVLGGPQVSYAGPGTLESLYPGVTYFVRGHGELALVALATGVAENGQLGLHIAGADDLCLRADIPLDRLPSPHLDGTLPIGRFVRWETQRGCPFRCSFCQHRESGSRLIWKEFGDDRLHAETLAFKEAGVERIAVLDPIFHASRSRAIALLGHMHTVGLSAELSIQCRFELVDDAFLQALDGMNVRLEFGLQTIHQAEGEAVGRVNNMDKVADVIGRLRGRGIPFDVSLIYGLPMQTLDSFRASVDWCLDKGVPRIRAWPLMLLRGTPLHAERARWDLVESVGDRIPIVVESNSFSRDEHAEMARIAASLDGSDLSMTRVA